MKILLTGATGFIGQHLLTALVKKYSQSSVLVLTSTDMKSGNFVRYDSTSHFKLSADYFDDITHVIHAGAFTPKDAVESNNISSCFENITFTNELVSFDYKSVSRFINLSTLDIYSPLGHVLSEISPVGPVSLYGSSKLYCEEVVKKFAQQKSADYINLRIGHVYGPGEERYKKVLPITIQNILENKPLEIWGDGSDLRSFIFIDDVVSAIVTSIDSSEKNIDVNVVSGVRISIKNLVNCVVKISGKSIDISHKPSDHEKRDLIFDNKKLLETFLCRETELLEGLQIEYDYMKKKYENNI
jgi:UDP-glucose 4-epimerase